MKQTDKFFFVILSLFMAFTAKGQQTFSWSVDLNQALEWSRIAPTGTMMVCTNDSLFGIDPEKQTLTWRMATIRTLLEGQMEEIPETPFYLINNFGDYVGDRFFKDLGAGRDRENFALLNSYTGELIFDSREMGWDRIEGQELMLESGVFFVLGVKDKERILAKVNIFGGGLQWVRSVPVPEDYSFWSSTTFKAPTIDAEGNFLFTFADYLWRLKQEDGSVMWAQPYAAIKNIAIDEQDPGFFYATAGLNRTLNRFSVQTGEPTWFNVVPGTLGNVFKKKEKLDEISIKSVGKIHPNASNEANEDIIGKTSFRIDEGDEYFVLSARGFNYYRKITGEPRWAEPHLTTFSQGDLQRVIPFENGYIGHLQRGDIQRLMLYNLEGKPVWKDPVQVLGVEIYLFVPTDDGIVFMTNGEIGILDMQTGERKLRKNFFLDVEKGFLPFFDWEKGYAFVYQKESMYQINFAEATSEEIIKKVKLRGDGQDFPTIFEPVEGGYLLANQQNFLKVDPSGNILFQGYYRRPGAPMWLRRGSVEALKMVTTVALAFLSAEVQYASMDAYYSGRMDARTTNQMLNTYSTNNPDNPLFAVGGLMFNAFDKIAERESATLTTQGEIFLLARLETGEVGLKRIRKVDGTVTGDLVIPDKEPEYAIDEVSRLLYYFPSRKRIEVFVME